MPTQQSDAGYTYELIDTWESEPWVIEPGRVYEPLDVTSTPDGRLFVLDSRPDGRYMHVFDDALAATDVIPLRGQSWPERFDGAADGAILTVGQSTSPLSAPSGKRRWRVEKYSPAGELLASYPIDVSSGRAISDIAVAPEGWTYLTIYDQSADEDTEPGRVEVLDGSGNRVGTIDAGDYFTIDHTVSPHYHLHFERVDVAPNGEVTVLMEFRRCG